MYCGVGNHSAVIQLCIMSTPKYRIARLFVAREKGKRCNMAVLLIILLCDLTDKVATATKTGRKTMSGTNSCPARAVPPSNPSK